MENHNINHPYLSADAVTVWMHAADHAAGDGNGNLDINEVVNYMNQTVATVQPFFAVTSAQIATELNGRTGGSLAHCQIYYVIGMFFMAICRENVPTNHHTYAQLINAFNQQYGDYAPVAQVEPVEPPPPVPGACKTENFPAFPDSPATIQDCRNCDGLEPFWQEPVSGYQPNQLMMLPTGNCAERNAMNRWINTHPTNPTDPLTGQRLPDYGGGRKRKSKKTRNKKSKKTRNKKSKKTKKIKKTRKSRR